MLDTIEPLPLDSTIGTTTAAATIPHFPIPSKAMAIDDSQHAPYVTHNPRSGLDSPVCNIQALPTRYWRADLESPAIYANLNANSVNNPAMTMTVQGNDRAVHGIDSTEASAPNSLRRPTMLKPLTAYNYFYRMERDNIVHGMQRAGDPIPPPNLDFSLAKQQALLYQRW
jgi:hypothetical protein